MPIGLTYPLSMAACNDGGLLKIAWTCPAARSLMAAEVPGTQLGDQVLPTRLADLGLDDDVARGGQEQGVPVCIGASDRRKRTDAGAATLVLDDHGLSEFGTEFQPDLPGHDIRRAAGGKRHHEPDRLAREALAERGTDATQADHEACCELANFHDAERAIRVLGAFVTDEAFLPLAKLSQVAKLHKSTALRIARTLASAGYLVQRDDGAWRLGPQAGRLGARYQQTFDVNDAITPLLRKLARSCGESASLFVREGNSRTCLLRVESSAEDRPAVRPGTPFPLTRGAPGRVILAFS